jgi:hypothetical protein
MEGGISKPSSFDSDIEQTFAGQVGAARLVKAFPRKALSECPVHRELEHQHDHGSLNVPDVF